MIFLYKMIYCFPPVSCCLGPTSYNIRTSEHQCQTQYLHTSILFFRTTYIILCYLLSILLYKIYLYLQEFIKDNNNGKDFYVKIKRLGRFPLISMIKCNKRTWRLVTGNLVIHNLLMCNGWCGERESLLFTWPLMRRVSCSLLMAGRLGS